MGRQGQGAAKGVARSLAAYYAMQQRGLDV